MLLMINADFLCGTLLYKTNVLQVKRKSRSNLSLVMLIQYMLKKTKMCTTQYITVHANIQIYIIYKLHAKENLHSTIRLIGMLGMCHAQDHTLHLNFRNVPRPRLHPRGYGHRPHPRRGTLVGAILGLKVSCRFLN